MKTKWIKTRHGYMQIILHEWSELHERFLNREPPTTEEMVEAAMNYIKATYNQTLDRMALGARMEAKGFAELAETLNILSDEETMEAIREGRADEPS